MTLISRKVKKGLREALTMTLKAVGTYLLFAVRMEWQTVLSLTYIS